MGSVIIYSGDGRGKSPAAMGRAIQAASEGKSVCIIQFLKGQMTEESSFLKRLEPEIKVFRFEKSQCDYKDLSEEKRREELANIQNGIHFARKVISTSGCDLLILDEILGLVDQGIVSVDELKEMLADREDMDIILTGIILSDDICVLADEVSRIETVRFKVFDHTQD